MRPPYEDEVSVRSSVCPLKGESGAPLQNGGILGLVNPCVGLDEFEDPILPGKDSARQRAGKRVLCWNGGIAHDAPRN